MHLSRALILLILVCLLVRLPWVFMVPMVEAPDEFSHFWVIRFLCEHLRLPTQAEVASGGPSAVYGSLPQLGYLPHVLTVKLLPFFDISMADRFGSLLMGVVTIVIAYYAGKILFPNSSLMSLALPWMMVFHPQLVLLHSYANSDATGCAIASLILYLLMLAIVKGPNMKHTLIAGLLIGWLLLSKYSGVAVVPAAIVALLLSGWLHELPLIKTAQHLILMLGSGALLSGWWFARNALEFNGDILGTKTMRNTWAVTYKRPLEFYMTPWQVVKEHAWWRMIAFSFWGLFGYMNRYLWRPLYIIYLIFMGLSAVGGIKYLGQNAFNERTPDRKELSAPAIWFVLAVMCLSNIAAIVAASTVNLGGPQGRYLFPSELGLMAFLIVGLSKLGEKVGRCAVIALLVFNAVVYVAAFVMLYNAYGIHYFGFNLKTYTD